MKLIRDLFYKYHQYSLREKASLTSTTTMIANFIWALAKFIFGICTYSFFLCISGVFSAGLGFAKSNCLIGFEKSKNNKELEGKIYLKTIAILFLISILYIIYMIRWFFSPDVFEYGTILSIGIAAMSFTELGFAISGLIKSNKQKDLLLSGMRCINLISAFTALVFTQIALLSFASSSSDSSVNAIAGMVFGGGSLLVCAGMIFNYMRFKKQA